MGSLVASCLVRISKCAVFCRATDGKDSQKSACCCLSDNWKKTELTFIGSFIYLCMYMCKYINMYIHKYMWKYMCISIYVYIYIYIYIYICMYTYVNMNMYTHMYIYIHIHIHMYIYIYKYVCVCLCAGQVCSNVFMNKPVNNIQSCIYVYSHVYIY